MQEQETTHLDPGLPEARTRELFKFSYLTSVHLHPWQAKECCLIPGQSGGTEDRTGTLP
jgi:hypothetical protein